MLVRCSGGVWFGVERSMGIWVQDGRSTGCDVWRDDRVACGFEVERGLGFGVECGRSTGCGVCCDVRIWCECEVG